jgi:transcriptional regulator with XRE-family HTH domain
MKKAQYTPFGQAIQRKLVEMRTRTGLTQRDLAQRLGREHSFVWRIEHGERRLDMAEFYWVCEALGQDAASVYASLVTEFRKLEKQESGD